MENQTVNILFSEHTKPFCVINSLDTLRGVDIEKELTAFFSKYYDIIVVRHDGKQYEYPGIRYAIDLCIEKNEPVLYLHTKGAYNNRNVKSPFYLCSHMKLKNINPYDIINLNLPRYARYLWKYEFRQVKKYMGELDANKPMVVCPYSGERKITWLNGFIMNPLAAKVLNDTFHKSNNRYYYEQMFKDTNVCVKGLRLNKVIPDGVQSEVWSDMITVYNKNHNTKAKVKIRNMKKLVQKKRIMLNEIRCHNIYFWKEQGNS